MTGRLQELIEEFKTMGASLEEAIKFAREHMVIERDDRARQRDAELKAKESEITMQSELELKIQKEQKELDLLENEKLAELEQRKVRMQHKHEMEIARLKQQRILSESESRVRMHKIDSRTRITENKLETGQVMRIDFTSMILGLGKFSNNVDDL